MLFRLNLSSGVPPLRLGCSTCRHVALWCADSGKGTRWVGTLVPIEWEAGREMLVAGDDLAVGDLVVVPRSDATLRFGEVLSIRASNICKVRFRAYLLLP